MDVDEHRYLYGPLVRAFGEDGLRSWIKKAHGIAKSRLRGSDADGDDAVQTALTTALVTLKGKPQEIQSTGFLYTALRWAISKKLTEQYRQPPSIESDPVDRSDPNKRREMQEVLENAINKLPTDLREAFMLRHDSGLKYDEIAQILGINEITVRVRVHKARMELMDDEGLQGLW